MMRCTGIGHRLRANSLLSVGKRNSRGPDNPPAEVLKSGILYLLTDGDTLLRVWVILRDNKTLVCYDEPERSLLVASVSLDGHNVLIARGIEVEKETFYPIYVVEKDQLKEGLFAESLADQREWLDAMTSAADIDQSLSLKGLNLECGKSKRPEKDKKKDSSGYFNENATPLSALRDLEESNRQTALRKATLLKQRMISTELKVDGLKKLQPEPIYKIPANKLYHQTQLDELNIRLENYMEAYHKYDRQRRRSISDSSARFTGEKNAKHNSTSEVGESNKYKSALKMFGNFLDTKLRGHKRVKSADIKSNEVVEYIRPRSISTSTPHTTENKYLNSEKDRILRTEIKASAWHEIEAFEKFIKEYLQNHHEEYFF